MADELDPKKNENEEMGPIEDDVKGRADEEFEDIDEDEDEADDDDDDEDETDNLPS